MKRRIVLTKKELQKCLKQHEGWTLNKRETELSRVFFFDSYTDGLVFIARIAVHAQVLANYPTIEFEHEKVRVRLSNRKLKKLTILDIALLERIERIVQKSAQ